MALPIREFRPVDPLTAGRKIVSSKIIRAVDMAVSIGGALRCWPAS
jgi:hypothetical protein